MIKERGAAMLIFFLILISTGTSLFLSSVNSHAIELRQQQDVRFQMMQAKQALIAYALSYDNFGFDNDGDGDVTDEGPGRLPCPDTDNDGIANSTITDCTINVRGRLPQSFSSNGNTFVLNDYFSSIDQQFWYAVSPQFREITTTGINNNTAGTFTVDGDSGYIAVIIAPGEALDFQDRAASQSLAGNYLEQNNTSGSAFINSYPAAPGAFNDQVIGIKISDISDQLAKIAMRIPFQAIDQYVSDNGTLPANKILLQNYMNNNGYRWFAGNPQENWIADMTYTYSISGSIMTGQWSHPSCPGGPITHTIALTIYIPPTGSC